jgi:hypothetical protein
MCLNVDHDEETYKKCLEQEIIHEGEMGENGSRNVELRLLMRQGRDKEEYILAGLHNNSRVSQQSLQHSLQQSLHNSQSASTLSPVSSISTCLAAAQVYLQLMLQEYELSSHKLSQHSAKLKQQALTIV